MIFFDIFLFHFFADFYTTISQMEGELPRANVLKTGRLVNLFSEPPPVTKVIANEDIYGGMHRLLTQDRDRKRLRERSVHPCSLFQE